MRLMPAPTSSPGHHVQEAQRRNSDAVGRTKSLLEGDFAGHLRGTPGEGLEILDRRVRYVGKRDGPPRCEAPMTTENAAIHTLHRYWIAANLMRRHFHAAAAAGGQPFKLDSDKGLEAFIYMSYWYGGLYVVIEGWRELGLEDDTIDSLLESGNVALLRRYRNGVFHYQADYFDPRLRGFVEEGESSVEWVRGVNDQFGRYFLEWAASVRASAAGD